MMQWEFERDGLRHVVSIYDPYQKIVLVDSAKAHAEDGVVPPSSAIVDFERKPVLFTSDSKSLVRKVGFDA